MNERGYLSLRIQNESVYLYGGNSYYVSPPTKGEVIVSQVVIRNESMGPNYYNVITTYGYPIDSDLTFLTEENQRLHNESWRAIQDANDYRSTITELNTILDNG